MRFSNALFATALIVAFSTALALPTALSSETCTTTGKSNGRTSCTSNGCEDPCETASFTVMQGGQSYTARSCVCPGGDDDGSPPPDPMAGCCDVYNIDLEDGTFLSLPMGDCTKTGCDHGSGTTCRATYALITSGKPPVTIIVASNPRCE